jgi:hypothetical protein
MFGDIVPNKGSFRFRGLNPIQFLFLVKDCASILKVLKQLKWKEYSIENIFVPIGPG